jgi:DHA2 family multidrug resistance protein
LAFSHTPITPRLHQFQGNQYLFGGSLAAGEQQPVVVNPWLIAIAVMLATFMEVLDTSIAAVALPHIAGSVSATNDEATWVLTSYLVANAVVLPASGWFSRRFGRKRFLITCIIIFTVSSFVCGAANSLWMLLLARAVQGAGGGALQPLAQAILLESFPKEKRGQAFAVFALGVVVAPVLGPSLGGYLTDTYSWRWAFYINIPIGILAVSMISRYVFDPSYIKNAIAGRFDSIGFGLLAVWLGALQIILDKGQEVDWFGAIWLRWAFAILIVTFVGFVWWQLRHPEPLTDLRVFRYRNFALGSVLIALFGAVIYGMVTLLPLFYQELMGYTALNAGIAVSPRGFGAIVAMPIIGFLTAKMDNRYIIAFGFALFGVCALRFGLVNLSIGQWTFFWAIVFSGFATGSIFVPLATVSMAELRNEEIGNASGLYNLFRNIGGSVGISVVNTIVARHEQLHRNELVRSIDAGSSQVQQQLQAYTEALQTNSHPSGASLGTITDQAYGVLNSTVNVQARLWSYVDDFRYLALLCFLCVPLVFFLKKAKAQKGAVAAAH